MSDWADEKAAAIISALGLGLEICKENALYHDIADALRSERANGDLICSMLAHDFIAYHDSNKHHDYWKLCEDAYCKSRREALAKWREVGG